MLKNSNRDYFKGIFCIFAGLLMLSLIIGLVSAAEIDLEAVKEIESGGNPRAVGNAGERGLYQIMPITLRSFNQRHEKTYSKDDLFNPEINRKIARWYLTKRIPEMLKFYGKPVTPKYIIWAYNAGIGRVNDGVMPEVTKRYLEKYKRLTGREENGRNKAPG